MLFDSKLLFATDQACAAAEDAVVVFGTHLDLGGTGLGIGEPFRVGAVVTTAFTDTADATAVLSVTTCATTGGTYVALASANAINVDYLIKGKEITLTVGPGCLQFVKLSVTAVGAALAVGKMIAGIVK